MFGHNLQTDCQRHTLVSPLNSGANAAPISVQALPVPAVVALKRPAIVFDIMSLTRDKWSYPQLLLIWRLYDQKIVEPCFKGKN